MKQRFLKCFCPVVVAAALAAPGICAAGAPGVSGRLTTSVYMYERGDTVGATSHQARLYQGLQLSLKQNRFALQAYGQVDGDLANRLAGDGKLRMFQLYLDYQDPGRLAQVRLGRQAVFAGVGVASVDGIQARVRPLGWLALKGFAGALVPANQRFALADSVARNNAWGGQVQITPTPALRASLSYARRRQLREGYSTVRSDSLGNLFTKEIAPADRASELASADLGWSIDRRTDLYGRADFDVYSRKASRAEVSLRTNVLAPLGLTGAYTFRSPRLPLNSIFSVFNTSDNHEIAGGLSYRVSPLLRINAETAGILYSGANSFRSTLGVDAGYAGLSYVHRAGYGGSLDGVNAALYRPLLKSRVTPNFQLSWAAYRPDSDTGGRTSLYSGAAGVQAEPVRGISTDAQVQVLHNRYYNNDVRFLFRLQYWFFSPAGKPGR